jgi:hypothetical protein
MGVYGGGEPISEDISLVLAVCCHCGDVMTVPWALSISLGLAPLNLPSDAVRKVCSA